MRKFTVVFMLIILFLSVFFAIFKPTLKQDKQTQNQVEQTPTRAEQLVTEQPQDTNLLLTNDSETRYLPTLEKIPTDVAEKDIKKIRQDVENIGEKQPQNIQINIPTQTNSRYEKLSKELSQKYNNDPNAEVSEEDFKNFVTNMMMTK